MAEVQKRKNQNDKFEDENEDDDDMWIGPMPHEAAKPKKKKGHLY